MVLMHPSILRVPSSRKKSHYFFVGYNIRSRIYKVTNTFKSNNSAYSFRRWVFPLSLEQVRSINSCSFHFYQNFILSVIFRGFALCHMQAFMSDFRIIIHVLHRSRHLVANLCQAREKPLICLQYWQSF